MIWIDDTGLNTFNVTSDELRSDRFQCGKCVRLIAEPEPALAGGGSILANNSWPAMRVPFLPFA